MPVHNTQHPTLGVCDSQFTVFKTPLFWCNIFIGLSGTLYTVLGGLRGVVWTDCMQFMIALLAPMAVVAKIFIDASAPNSTIQPLTGTDVARYIGNYSFDLTSDETIWACSLGTSAMAIYRVCWDQVVAQRLLASRTLTDAQRLKPDTVLKTVDEVLVVDLAVVWDANVGVPKDKTREKAAK
nr:sodium-dependent multivitamin transporter-like [Dermacentor andersoni]